VGIKQLLAGPAYFDDAERGALARIFNIVSLAVILALGAGMFTNLFFSEASFPVVLPVLFACVGALIAAAHLGHLRVASSLLPAVVLAGSAYLLLTRDGVHDTGVLAIAGLLVIGGILLTRRALVIFTMAALAVILSAGYAEMSGLLHNRLSSFTDMRYVAGVCVVFVVIAIAVHLLAESLYTSLRQAQEKSAALGASEERLAKMIAQSPEAITIGSAESGTFIEANPACEQLTGYTREELIGRSPMELGFWPDPEERGRFITDLRRDEVVHGRELRLKRKAGELRDILASAALIDLKGRKFILFQAVDVTERRRAEHLLEESEARLAKMIEASPEAITIASIEDGTFILVNPAGQRLCGYTREELIGNSAVRLGFYVDPEERRSIVADLQRDEVVYGREIRLRRKDGEVRDTLTSAALIDFKDRKLILFQAIDITERKSAERALREHEKLLRELSAHHDAVREGERAHIAREIHDELGQALTALKMDLSVLTLKFGETTPQIREQVQELKGRVDAIIQVVRDVATALRPAALDLGILAGLEWLVEEFQKRNGIRCTVSVAGSDIALGEDRSIVLFRIVQESLTNVSRHASARNVEILLDHDAERIRLDVQDDGVGFDVDAARRKKTFGLLGIRERVIMLRGELTIASAPGRGTRVSVSMPIETGQGLGS
jgi:PAS domain S-box-containing protein